MVLTKKLNTNFFTRLIAVMIIIGFAFCSVFGSTVSAESTSDRNAAIQSAIEEAHKEYDGTFTVVESSAEIFEENDSCYLIYINLEGAGFVSLYVVQKGINKVVYSAGAQDRWEGILDEIYMPKVTLEDVSSEPAEMSFSNEVIDVIGKDAAYIISKYGTPTEFDSGEDDFMGRQLYYTDGLDFQLGYGMDLVKYVWGTAEELIKGFDNESFSANEMAAALSTDGSYSYNEIINYGDYGFPYNNISMNTVYGTIQIECENLTVYKDSAARLIIDDTYLKTDNQETSADNSSSGITVLINGSKMSFDVEPYIENGVTMVPMRAIFEALGAEITYAATTKTIFAFKDGTAVVLTVGSSTASINGINSSIQSPATVINGTTMVPLRFVAEALGAEVNWNSNTKTVTILG